MVTCTRGSPEVKGTGNGRAREGESQIHGDHGTTIISHHVKHWSRVWERAMNTTLVTLTNKDNKGRGVGKKW